MKTTFNFLLFGIVLFMASCGKKTVETKPIAKEITETVFASGILEADNMYALTAQIDGYITDIYFEEGALVSNGNVVAIVENKEASVNTNSSSQLLSIADANTKANAPLLLQTEANIQIAKQKLDQEAIQEQRYKQLLESNSIARIEYENVLLGYKTALQNYNVAKEGYNHAKQLAKQNRISQDAQKQLNDVASTKNRIVALQSGKIFKKLKQKGDFIRRGETIAMIGNDKFIYAKINVDESNIAKLKVGQNALIQLNTQKETNYNASVIEILPQFDEATRSYICKLKFTDQLQFSIINTPLQCNIIIGTPQMALLIPKNYLDFDNNVQIKGKKEKTKVVTKIIGSEWVEILSGITADDILVTDNLKTN